MSSSKKKKDAPNTLTQEQLDVLVESQQNLKDFINLANKVRNSSLAKDTNFFKRFFMNADKFVR